jgi:hypothetical protein
MGKVLSISGEPVVRSEEIVACLEEHLERAKAGLITELGIVTTEVDRVTAFQWFCSGSTNDIMAGVQMLLYRMLEKRLG